MTDAVSPYGDIQRLENRIYGVEKTIVALMKMLNTMPLGPGYGAALRALATDVGISLGAGNSANYPREE